MKWKILSMLDPGDGIVSTTIVEHDSDDIIDVLADAVNGECVDKDGEQITFNGWIFGAEAQPPGADDE